MTVGMRALALHALHKNRPESTGYMVVIAAFITHVVAEEFAAMLALIRRIELEHRFGGHCKTLLIVSNIFPC